MRLKTTCALFLVLAGVAVRLPAQPRQFGLGLVLVDPSGLTAKAWLGGRRAVSGAVGWSGEKGHYLQVQADYLFVDRRVSGDANVDLDLYFGAGGKIIFRDYDAAWLRVPLGLDLRLKKSPFNFFFEITPVFNFADLRLSGAVGFRYLFGS